MDYSKLGTTMNKKITKWVVMAALVLFPVLVFSQPSPGANANGTPVQGAPIAGGGAPGGGAPIGSGIGFLLILAAAYGGVKIYELRKRITN